MTVLELQVAFQRQVNSIDNSISFTTDEIQYWVNEAIKTFIKTRYSGTNIKGESFEQSQKRIDDLKGLITEEIIDGSDLTTGTIKPNSYVADLTSLTDWSKYLFTLGEEVEITYTKLGESGTTAKRQGVTEATIDTYRSKIDDPYCEYKLHYEEAKPIRLFYGSDVELITDGNYTVTKYYIRYLKKAQEISFIEVATGEIVEGILYDVCGDAITYDGDTYNPGDVFLGTATSAWATAGTKSYVRKTTDLPRHTHNEILKISVNMALENIRDPRYQTHSEEIKSME